MYPEVPDTASWTDDKFRVPHPQPAVTRDYHVLRNELLPCFFRTKFWINLRYLKDEYRCGFLGLQNQVMSWRWNIGPSNRLSLADVVAVVTPGGLACTLDGLQQTFGLGCSLGIGALGIAVWLSSTIPWVWATFGHGTLRTCDVPCPNAVLKPIAETRGLLPNPTLRSTLQAPTNSCTSTEMPGEHHLPSF
ncbi:hypothetical protein BAUCODRAFT_250861 [Baudoinia panamericana UAMH 10762]|uniref:Uncharacterized protein n=1 Tax=Baudoinia panamericana (strain UAMH 10762) TaxID=717646 RepID=M2N4M7_BAUPA|nr:uncharacterized protein BAUCODRAFT_250861 [Baudoinia panamericana UAMH 10762]EMC93685.1 hypothetical protein BAUCODRAFT_250861 [Baudoinia panamericana UAMH 10762]